MIRSGSKLLKKGSSVRNINKVGSKFRFVLEFETADKLLSSNNFDVVATWERKGIVLSTRTAAVDSKTRTATFSHEKLEQVITLFKSKGGAVSKSFNEKLYLFCVRTNDDRGRVIGKALLNFAEYVEVPEYSKRISVPLSHGGRLIMRVTSTYLGEAKRKNKSSGGASSVRSALSSSTIGAKSSKNNTAAAAGTKNTPVDYENVDQSDLSDLFIDDDFDGIPDSALPSSHIAPSQSRKKINASSSQKPIAPSKSRKEQPVKVESAVPLVPSRSRRRERAPEKTETKRLAISTNADDLVAEGLSVGKLKSTVLKADYDELKRENRALLRKNNDISRHIELLEDKLAAADAHRVEDLEDAVESLKKEAHDLKERLAREPIYADVVRELKDAKMGLAILKTENEELKLGRRNQ